MTLDFVLTCDTSAATPKEEPGRISSVHTVIASQPSPQIRANWPRERTWRKTDVVECELSDARVKLEEERQRLANAASSAEHRNLGEL